MNRSSCEGFSQTSRGHLHEVIPAAKPDLCWALNTLSPHSSSSYGSNVLGGWKEGSVTVSPPPLAFAVCICSYLMKGVMPLPLSECPSPDFFTSCSCLHGSHFAAFVTSSRRPSLCPFSSLLPLP